MNQTYHNIEIIIVDDGSTDGTKELVEENYSVYRNKIKYIKNKKSSGAAVARNIGIDNAEGSMIAFLDSDDEWGRCHLEKSLNFISNREIDGSFSLFEIVKNQSNIITNKFKIFKKHLSPTDYILNRDGDPRTSTFVMKADKVKRVYFDEQLAKHQDWDFFIRFAEKFYINTFPKITTKIHVDENDDVRMSSRNNLDATNFFLHKHKRKASHDSLATFYYVICKEILKRDGKSSYVKEFNREMLKYGGTSFLIKFLLVSLLNSPICNLDLVLKMFYAIKYR